MEPIEDNLKNTENAFKDMYSRIHNVPREEIEDISVEELTSLENSLVKRASKVRFKEIKSVSTKNTKKEDIGKEDSFDSEKSSMSVPRAEEVSVENKQDAEETVDKVEKSTESYSKPNIPDVTDLDKRLKLETANLPEPPDPNKVVESDISEQPESSKAKITENKSMEVKITPSVEAEPSRPEEIASKNESNLKTQSVNEQPVNISKVEPILSIEQEQNLRAEYPFMDFDKKPENEQEEIFLNKLKTDLMTKIDERAAAQQANTITTEEVAKKEPASTQSQNVAVENTAEIKSATNIPTAENIAQSAPAQPINPVESIQPGSTPIPEIPIIPPITLPESLQATIDSLKNINPGNINEMIDQMTAVAMGFQKNLPAPISPPTTTSTSEASLRSINENIAGLNKSSGISTKELKASIDGLKAVAEQILAYLPNIQSNNIFTNNNTQSQDVRQINTGLMQKYKNEVRQQYGAGIIDLSNDRPTMPGFTI